MVATLTIPLRIKQLKTALYVKVWILKITMKDLRMGILLLTNVAKYVFVPNVGFDQLVAFDDGIRGMNHDGDEEFPQLIESCRDDLQILIESKILGSGRLLEENVLDSSRMAVPFKHYCLYRIWLNKGNSEKAESYKKSFDALFEASVGALQVDSGQDGQEDSDVGGDVGQVQLIR